MAKTIAIEVQAIFNIPCFDLNPFAVTRNAIIEIKAKTDVFIASENWPDVQ